MQPAKQHFLEKLQLEWAEEKAQGEESRQKRQEEDKQMQKSREAPVSETPLILTSLDGKASIHIGIHVLKFVELPHSFSLIGKDNEAYGGKKQRPFAWKITLMFL